MGRVTFENAKVVQVGELTVQVKIAGKTYKLSKKKIKDSSEDLDDVEKGTLLDFEITTKYASELGLETDD